MKPICMVVTPETRHSSRLRRARRLGIVGFSVAGDAQDSPLRRKTWNSGNHTRRSTSPHPTHLAQTRAESLRSRRRVARVGSASRIEVTPVRSTSVRESKDVRAPGELAGQTRDPNRERRGGSMRSRRLARRRTASFHRSAGPRPRSHLKPGQSPTDPSRSGESSGAEIALAGDSPRGVSWQKRVHFPDVYRGNCR